MKFSISTFLLIASIAQPAFADQEKDAKELQIFTVMGITATATGLGAGHVFTNYGKSQEQWFDRNLKSAHEVREIRLVPPGNGAKKISDKLIASLKAESESMNIASVETPRPTVIHGELSIQDSQKYRTQNKFSGDGKQPVKVVFTVNHNPEVFGDSKKFRNARIVSLEPNTVHVALDGKTWDVVDVMQKSDMKLESINERYRHVDLKNGKSSVQHMKHQRNQARLMKTLGRGATALGVYGAAAVAGKALEHHKKYSGSDDKQPETVTDISETAYEEPAPQAEDGPAAIIE